MDDKIVPLSFHTRVPVEDHNERILQRMRGVEAFSPTAALRWNSGVLEQCYRGTASGESRWIPVPDAADMLQRNPNVQNETPEA